MNVTEFVTKWTRAELSERSASQQHFLDLCEVFNHPKPAEADPTGESFTFERGAAKRGGGDGWADVWKKGYFGWEYKRKHRDLEAAYEQLLQYREALENPPLLVVCDMDRIVVRTNFTATPTVVHDIPLSELGRPRHIEILRSVFHEPEKLKPGTTSEAITSEAATRLARIAQALRDRGLEAHRVAHFLDRIIFCLFAEDIGLLPRGLFTKLAEKTRGDAGRFTKLIGHLFESMSTGGDFGLDTIRHFNGNLFEDGPVLELTAEEIEHVYAAAKLDWSAVDPSIFGTLFERGMDPAKRSQLGAHYTSRQDIETLIEPVVMQPLRREWDETREIVECLLTYGKKRLTGREKKTPTEAALRKGRREAPIFVQRFLQKLAGVKVLDPACGSGNFLYVVLQKLKDLEKEVILYAMNRDLGGFLPMVGPWQLYGIEINPYAHDLAQMTVWIGYLQWIRTNGFGWPADPVLRPMDNFQCKDAILDLTDPDNPREPTWPKVHYIVGNPPFLGGQKMRGELGDDYVQQLRALYAPLLPGGVDLCCYWFEKARREVNAERCSRAGLLATQGIRGGANREILKAIAQSGSIFFAESDRPWILDGANVHVSMVGFCDEKTESAILDGEPVTQINANLTASVDLTTLGPLQVNRAIAYQGPVRVGPFNVTHEEVTVMLTEPNPTGKPNSDVLRPSLNGGDITKRWRYEWVIDFGGLPLKAACQYETPFGAVESKVKPRRLASRDRQRREKWWLHGRSGDEIRRATSELCRYIAMAQTAKYMKFRWFSATVSPEQTLIVFARSDDYFFGVLHSRLHEVWARAQGTQLRERESGFRYTPTTCFETFAFPQGDEGQKERIGEAARELNELREGWLNPAEWTRQEVLEFPGSVDGPWARYVHEPDGRGIGTVRYPRTVARDAECEKKLKKRTLTNLYNQRPTWLDLAHRKLDAAVFDAYGWDPAMTDEQILEHLLALNLQRAETERDTGK